MRPLNEKDGGDGGPFPPGALLRADSHRLRAGDSSHSASAQAGGGRSSSMTHFLDNHWKSTAILHMANIGNRIISVWVKSH